MEAERGLPAGAACGGGRNRLELECKSLAWNLQRLASLGAA